MTTSDEWLGILRGSDTRAQDAVNVGLASFLRRTLARGVGRSFSDVELDDLVQESMLRIHDKLDTFAGRSQFSTWAASVAINVALGELRRRKHQTVTLEVAVAAGQEAMTPAEGPTNIARSQRDRILRDAFDERLTDRQRTAMLAGLNGLPLSEIARRMGTSTGTLYKLMHDARKRLRAHFDEIGLTVADLMAGEE